MEEEYGNLVEKRNVDGGRMLYKDYVRLVEKIEGLSKEIEQQQLRNDGMENAREVIFDAEVIGE